MAQTARRENADLSRKSPIFDASVFSLKGSFRLVGWWQSEKYFLDIEPAIRRELRIRPEHLKNTDRVLETMRRTRAVSVHFRRGDYVGLEKFEMQNPFDYYSRALDDMASHVENATFFVFSDDIAWVKNHWKTSHRTVCVSENGVLSNLEDLHLMQNCEHHIIANSTFSWWGAWLNPSASKRIIAPQRWFNDDHDYSDAVPASWIRL